MVLFTPDDVHIISGFPIDSGDDIEVTATLKLPGDISALTGHPVVPQSTFFSISTMVKPVVKVRTGKTVLSVALYITGTNTMVLATPTPTQQPNSDGQLSVEEEYQRKEAVVVTLGLTTLQQVRRPSHSLPT